MFLGKWNRSVYMTYLGVSLAILGMLRVAGGQGNLAVVCLIWAGVCDLLDGPIARRVERTEEEKAFGVQIDTVADVVSFVVFPIVLAIGIGLRAWGYWFLYVAYAVAGLARLASFNVDVCDSPDQPARYYRGLPVTYAALIFGILYATHYFLPVFWFRLVYAVMMLVTAVFFIIDVPVRKPHGWKLVLFGSMALAVTLLYLLVP